MDGRKRSSHLSRVQKKRLIECMTKHPELITCKVTSGVKHEYFRELWQKISAEINSLPGARKSWRRWRKTWQDLRSKTRKHHRETNEIKIKKLTEAEQEALGIVDPSTVNNMSNSTEFIPLDQPITNDTFSTNELESNPSLSEPESPPEAKVFTEPPTKKYKLRNSKKSINQRKDHSNDCTFNCDLIAVNEKRKIKMKEDYLNFKKDYLRQKLKLIKEQTEALKSIARELSK